MQRVKSSMASAGLPAPPIEPMLAKIADALPSEPGFLFEPKWDGFRALVFRGEQTYLQSRDLRPRWPALSRSEWRQPRSVAASATDARLGNPCNDAHPLFRAVRPPGGWARNHHVPEPP